MASLLPVAEARRLIVAALAPLPRETVALNHALGRVLASDAIAKLSHPPADVSAMDGYALRSGDIAQVPHRLAVVGQSTAGRPWPGTLQPGQAVRIFTGAYVPAGADTIVIQEDTSATGDSVTIAEAPMHGRHIRPRGQDFTSGERVLAAPRRLDARDIGLLGAMNLPQVEVFRRPRVGVLSTGDEIVMPGEAVGEGQIVSANGPGLCAFVRECGGEDIHLGVVRDELAALRTAIARAERLDMLVTSGGVSVGDHDLMAKVMHDGTAELAFHRIALRPGKPLLFGRINGLPLMGLPGNPVSAMVCAILFLGPALSRLQGLPGAEPTRLTVRLGAAVKANDGREDYLRATLRRDEGGALVATPFPKQDSAMISALAKAQALVVRPPHAPVLEAGAFADAIVLEMPF